MARAARRLMAFMVALMACALLLGAMQASMPEKAYAAGGKTLTVKKLSDLKNANTGWYSNASEYSKIVISKKIALPKNCTNLFNGFSNVREIVGFQKLDAKKVTNASYMFDGCSSLKNVNLSKFKAPNLSNIQDMFRGCSSLASIDMSKIGSAKIKVADSLFDGCSSLKKVNLKNLKFDKVSNLSFMFYGCKSMKSIDLSKLNAGNVDDMCAIFGSCTALTSFKLPKFNPKKTIDVFRMFEGCKSLKKVDLSQCGIKKITGDTFCMFEDCKKLESVNMAGITTILDSSGKDWFDMRSMFSGCRSLRYIDISGFDNAGAPRYISMWFTPVSTQSAMFEGCDALDTIKLGRRFSLLTTGNDFPGESWLNVQGKAIEKTGEFSRSADITAFKRLGIKLSKYEYTYNGNARKPKVEVFYNGAKLKAGIHYKVSMKDNKLPGAAKVTVTGLGQYAGLESMCKFAIYPSKASISKLQPKKNGITVKFKSVKHATGYEFEFSSYKDMHELQSDYVEKGSATSKTINSLYGKTRYYIHMRAYVEVGNKKYCGAWSSVKSAVAK